MTHTDRPSSTHVHDEHRLIIKCKHAATPRDSRKQLPGAIPHTDRPSSTHIHGERQQVYITSSKQMRLL